MGDAPKQPSAGTGSDQRSDFPRGSFSHRECGVIWVRRPASFIGRKLAAVSDGCRLL